MADCIGTGFPQFSCALVQMRYSIEENGGGEILKGETSGGKEMKKKGEARRKEQRGNGDEDM